MPATVPAFLRPLLACPDCGASLAVTTSADGAGEGRTAGDGDEALTCSSCRAEFIAQGGIARLLPASDVPRAERRTRHAFDRQWRTYGRLRRLFGKDPAAMAKNLAGARMGARIDTAWYRGKRVLDAGCGHGRYLAAFRTLGAQVVGLDAGRGPEEGRTDLSDPGLAVVQGDVLRPPFRDGTFDLVFCDGVLHHTRDPAGGYRALARLVKPGGALYVWLYPREGRLRELAFGAFRSVCTRLPGGLVPLLAFALAPLTAVVRSYSGTRFGRATWGECAQVVHDWIAPPLQSHHTVEEVRSWAAAAGLDDVEVLPIPTGILAWRPSAARTGAASHPVPPPRVAQATSAPR